LFGDDVAAAFAADFLQNAALDLPPSGRHRGLLVTAPAFGCSTVEEESPAGLFIRVAEVIGFSCANVAQDKAHKRRGADANRASDPSQEPERRTPVRPRAGRPECADLKIGVPSPLFMVPMHARKGKTASHQPNHAGSIPGGEQATRVRRLALLPGGVGGGFMAGERVR